MRGAPTTEMNPRPELRGFWCPRNVQPGAVEVHRRPVATLVSPSARGEGKQTVRSAAVTPEGSRIRWVELPGQEPPRVYVHGLGATSPAYFAEVAVHPLLAGRRSLLIDMLGHGISDRPTDFDYTLESHADALAAALTDAGVTGAELIAHSMGARRLSSWPPGTPNWSPAWSWSTPTSTRSRLHPAPRAAAASPRTPRRSSWRAAGRRSGTGPGPTGGPRCAWQAGKLCTAARSTSPEAPPPPCVNICWT